MPEAGGATERLAWVEQFAQTRDAASVCRQFAISRATLRKWWLRYEASGPAGLEEASRKPRSSPNRKVFEARGCADSRDAVARVRRVAHPDRIACRS